MKMEPYHAHDVLCGRGKGTYNHVGNYVFRELVMQNRNLYNDSERKEKIYISKSIVNAIQSQDPPGRFLEFDSVCCQWREISNSKAVEKTSQALRQRLADERRGSNSSNSQSAKSHSSKESSFNFSKQVMSKTQELKALCEQHSIQKSPLSDKSMIIFDKNAPMKKGSTTVNDSIRSCLLFEKTLEESCNDLGVKQEELDSLILTTFTNKNEVVSSNSPSHRDKQAKKIPALPKIGDSKKLAASIHTIAMDTSSSNSLASSNWAIATPFQKTSEAFGELNLSKAQENSRASSSEKSETQSKNTRNRTTWNSHAA